MSNKHRKGCITLNYIEHFLILSSTVTGCISNNAFASLIDNPFGITRSTTGLKLVK